MMKKPTANQKGLKKLPQKVRNKMGYMSKGGKVKQGYNMGGSVPQVDAYDTTGADMMRQQQQMMSKPKQAMAKGGKVYANCGASVKPNGTSRK